MLHGISGADNDNLLVLLQKERELIGKVKLGEEAGIKETLADILQHIHSLKSAEWPIVKTRVLELVLVLSRAAVDGGASYQEVSQVNTDFILAIGKYENMDELNTAVQQVVETFMQEVSKVKIENNQMLRLTQNIKKFILENYDQKLTLEEIASSVYLSAYYVCHVFKEVQGITIIEYLNQVRIEKAKQLLGDPRYNIHEISRRLGYKDPSYFAKVFRQKEGTSPSQYRKQA